MNTYTRRAAVALALIAGSASLWAQGPAPAAGAATNNNPILLDPIVTTGTRFGTASSQADVPVIIIGKMQIDQTPVTEVADYLKELPSFSGAGNTNDSTTNGGTGARNIDLRGLGSSYTLILLNGRRLSYAGTDNVVDVNQVPVTAVDHIEVLTSGASAVYGTDAIGGVVNIITRKGQNGGELQAYYGDIDHKTDLGRRQFAFSFSGSEGKIDFMIGGQWFKQNGIYSSDFPWSSTPGPTSNIYPYRLVMPNSLFTAGATGTGNYVVKWKPGEGGRRDAGAAGDFRAYDGRLPDVGNPDNGGDQFPFYLYTPLLRPEERYNVFAFTSYQLTPRIKVTADIMYRYAYSYNQLAPAAIPVPALGAIVIPSTNYWNNKIFGAAAPTITAGGWRLSGLGPRLDTAETSGIWFNGGLEGKVADWNWRIEALLSQESNQFMSGNTTSVDLINAELAKTTPDAYNPFSSKLEANAAVWPSLRRNAFVNDRSRLANLSATIDGKVFDMPAGPARGAFSVEWNKLEGYSHPDALTQQTPLGFNGTPFPTDGARNQWGVSAEVELPIIAQVTGRVAARHDDYSDIGGANVAQVAVRYQPSKELLLRGSWGQGFIAPSLLQLHEGPQVTNPSFLDPTENNGDGTWGANSQVSITRIGNPNLKPEKADMWNVGVVYSPAQVKGLTMSLDYWNVDQTDVVATADDYARVVADRFWKALGATDAARDAAARNPTSLAAAVAKIRTETGVTVVWEADGGTAGFGGLSQNNIAMTGVSRANLAGQRTDGFDMGAVFNYDASELGNYIVDLKATYTRSFDYQALAGDPFQELAGKYGSGFEGIWPKWRFNANVMWRKGNFGATANFKHVQRVELDSGVDPIYNRNYLQGFSTWDFQASYRMPSTKTQFAVGVENAFNEGPPQTSFALNNFVPAGAYDVKGRLFYVRVTQRF